MDNDIKIEKDIERAGKNIFLRDEIRNLEDNRQIYSLDQEFEKTKSNKNTYFYIFIAEFVLIVILGAVALTMYVQNKSLKYSFKIDESRDVKLGSMLENSKSDGTFNNFTQLYAIKMEKQRRDLILKYNPIFDSGKFKRIFNSKMDISERRIPVLKSDFVETSVLDELEKNINSHSLIMNRLKQIAFTNSVAPAVSSLDNISLAILNDYANICINFNMMLIKYTYALDYLSKAQIKDGFIVDPRDPKDVQVFIKEPDRIKSDDVMLIMRNNDSIGKIKINKQGKYISAEITESRNGVQISPFDQLKIQ